MNIRPCKIIKMKYTMKEMSAKDKQMELLYEINSLKAIRNNDKAVRATYSLVASRNMAICRLM